MGMKRHTIARRTRFSEPTMLAGALLASVVFSSAVLAALPGHSRAAPAVAARTGSGPVVPVVPLLVNRFLDTHTGHRPGRILRPQDLGSASLRTDIFFTWDRLREQCHVYSLPPLSRSALERAAPNMRSRVYRRSQLEQARRADRDRNLRGEGPMNREVWTRWRALARVAADGP